VELQHQRVELKAVLKGRRQQRHQFLDRQHLAAFLLAHCPVILTICRAVRLGLVVRRQEQAGQQIYSTAN
jgi:hypothetical protein